jgi:3',5'-cyclic AMP phosphodiesterase CpdA
MQDLGDETGGKAKAEEQSNFATIFANENSDPDIAWGQMHQDQVFADIKREAGRHYDPSTHTRVVCMSDTHGQHRSMVIPPGDVLIHGGDFSNTGQPAQVQDLADFFGEQHHATIVCIAGNHDLTFQPDYYKEKGLRFHRKLYDAEAARSSLTTTTNCVYLEDQSHSFGNLECYGSPW